MRHYTFDMTLKAAVTLEAESEDEARRILEGVLDAATFTAWEGPPDDPDDEVTGECSLDGPLVLVRKSPRF